MWPNENSNYREKRDELLEKEAALRALSEEVAAERRALPDGGQLKENYRLIRVRDHEPLHFKELFEDGKDTLFVYSFMYRPAGKPCPMCVSLLDGLENTVPQLQKRINVAVFAKATPTQLLDFAHHRDWQYLPLYSTADCTYNKDYRGEDDKGNQLPVIHVFRKRDEGIFHFWSSELLFHGVGEKDWESRHADTIWPLWNVLDLTPDGRGTDWHPALD